MRRLARHTPRTTLTQTVVQTVPMTLPVVTPPTFQGVDRRMKIHCTLQSMSFICQPFQGKDETIAEKVAAVLVYEDHGECVGSGQHLANPGQSLRRQNLYAEADWKQSRLNDD